jgi:sigma-B regulation protein RsbU (phosphoserine phosphatase)
MPGNLRITIFENRRKVLAEEHSAPMEFGRQDRGDDDVYRSRVKDGCVRIPIARKDETAVARKQLLVEPLHDGWVRLSNQSREVRLRILDDQSDLLPSTSRDASLPVTLRIGTREVRIEADDALRSLVEAPLTPGAAAPDHTLLHTIAAERTSDGESLIAWLQATMDVQSAANEQEGFERAASALVELLHLDAGRVLTVDRGEWVVRTIKVAQGPARGAPLTADWEPSTRVLASLRTEKRTFWQAPVARSGSMLALETLVAAPILDRQGDVIGALYGHRGGGASGGPQGWRPITRLQAMLVQLLANGLSAGLARKKLVQVERDMEIGRQIQGGFLPKELPTVAGFEVACHFRPAREVSGDFYDAFVLPSGRVALVMADVCDKGLGAALFMTLFRSLLRAFAEQDAGSGIDPRATPPAESMVRSAVERTNSYVAATHGWQCMFCTLFFGVLDTATGAVAYVNAGHDAPILLGAGGIKSRLTKTGPVVGIDASNVFGTASVVLEPGDTFLAYTDGITEARNAAGQFFGEKRLLSIVQAKGASADTLVSGVMGALYEHIAGAEPHDDVTMLAVRRLA